MRAWLEFVEDRPGSWRFYAAALICQFLALAAKTTACTLPAALLLTLWIQGQTNPSSPACCKSSRSLRAGLAMGMVSVWFERYHQFAVGETFALSPLVRVLIASRAVWFYLGKLVWPVNLSFSYARWQIDPGNALSYIWLAAAALAAGGDYLSRKSSRTRPGNGGDILCGHAVAAVWPYHGIHISLLLRGRPLSIRRLHRPAGAGRRGD